MKKDLRFSTLYDSLSEAAFALNMTLHSPFIQLGPYVMAASEENNSIPVTLCTYHRHVEGTVSCHLLARTGNKSSCEFMHRMCALV